MKILMKYWYFAPTVVVFIILMCAVYFYLIRHKLNPKTGYFVAALCLFILCTCSPLHWLGQYYLFSAHMVSHILLFLVVSPLLILSIRSKNDSPVSPSFLKISKVIAAVPWLAWILGISIMWFWHIPAIFDDVMPMSATGINGFLHHIQGISMVLIGLIFWWPVLGPAPTYRLPALQGILYLFTACISCSLLGLIITFSPMGMYSYYTAITDPFGYSLLIQNQWGISRIIDHQMAGLIMWVPGCLIYLTGALYLLRDWFMDKDVPRSPAPMYNDFQKQNITLYADEKQKTES